MHLLNGGFWTPLGDRCRALPGDVDALGRGPGVPLVPEAAVLAVLVTGTSLEGSVPCHGRLQFSPLAAAMRVVDFPIELEREVREAERLQRRRTADVAEAASGDERAVNCGRARYEGERARRFAGCEVDRPLGESDELV